MVQHTTDDKSTIVQVPDGTNPLPEPVLIKIFETIWRHQAMPQSFN